VPVLHDRNLSLTTRVVPGGMSPQPGEAEARFVKVGNRSG
jgi:hypothetical protein